jgi:hypothetical protein
VDSVGHLDTLVNVRIMEDSRNMDGLDIIWRANDGCHVTIVVIVLCAEDGEHVVVVVVVPCMEYVT